MGFPLSSSIFSCQSDLPVICLQKFFCAAHEKACGDSSLSLKSLCTIRHSASRFSRAALCASVYLNSHFSLLAYTARFYLYLFLCLGLYFSFLFWWWLVGCFFLFFQFFVATICIVQPVISFFRSSLILYRSIKNQQLIISCTAAVFCRTNRVQT